jgi:hypothetical protein
VTPIYGPFSLCVIHKEGLCPSSGDINQLMMMMTQINFYHSSHPSYFTMSLDYHRDIRVILQSHSITTLVIKPLLPMSDALDFNFTRGKRSCNKINSSKSVLESTMFSLECDFFRSFESLVYNWTRIESLYECQALEHCINHAGVHQRLMHNMTSSSSS